MPQNIKIGKGNEKQEPLFVSKPEKSKAEIGESLKLKESKPCLDNFSIESELKKEIKKVGKN